MEGVAAEIRAGAEALESARSAVFVARAAVESEEAKQAGGDAGGAEGAAKGGVLTAAMKVILQKYKISVQRYWNATLVGPDVRKFLLSHGLIIAELAAKIAEVEGPAAAAKFSVRHLRVLKELTIVSHPTRTTEMLTPVQLSELDLACTNFGVAYRLSYDKILTVKGHIIEQHVSAFARRYGTCGAFGEYGIESLYPWDTRCRLITWTMRNPEARHKATMSLLRIKVMAPSTAATPKHKRVSKQAKNAATAAAAAAAPGPVLGAGVATLLDIRRPARH